MQPMRTYELANDAYHLTVRPEGKEIHLSLRDQAMGCDVAAGPYIYRVVRPGEEGSVVSEWLAEPTIMVAGDTLTITGKIAGLELTQTFRLPAHKPYLEEEISLHNPGPGLVALRDLALGMQRRITDEVGHLLPEVKTDRIVAIPFRHRPTDPPHWDNDFDMAHFSLYAGREHRANDTFWTSDGYMPSHKRFSEGWAWTHGEHTLGIFKFNQEAMEFSVLATEVTEAGLALRFGGSSPISGEPSILGRIRPDETVTLGVTRYQTVRGDYRQAMYAFRAFLDERGCRFPADFNPPVHWNELYDNAEWSLSTPGHPPTPRHTRALTYTKELILAEAAKAKEYGCEALYLDPGWDTDFATFIWGEEWLGNRKEFIREVWEKYGLRVSLHTPLATWLSLEKTIGRGVSSWPREAFRMDREGKVVEGSICLGSRQYLDEAERRLLEHCADGVVFLMFDGNLWNGGCWNPDHGHPVPYTMEDHCRANVELARRIHARYPQVLIEMHDMIASGTPLRYTPVYYKYGLPGSYDENWGFELMWQPMEDILSGRARALYYYNLACNVPIYLHIDLRDDNEHCLVLWWYASTCRHLGIGGTHPNPRVAEAQRLAMKRYRQLDRFYKRGDFYGISEEIHLHVLPAEGAFVVNLFNLSDESRVITGSIPVAEMGLPRDAWYVTPKGGWFDARAGTFVVHRRLAPWAAEVAEVRLLR
jgi:hypothetical protein